MGYLGRILHSDTPQSEQENSKQVVNNAGGYVFTVDDWARLERFLILGSEGGTYYVGERQLTKENAAVVERCAKLDSLRTLQTICRISEEGRAPKNDEALFALAICSSLSIPVVGPLQRVARTASHLFQFVSYVTAMRGWGRGLRRAVAYWYLNQGLAPLAYQGIKYRNRNGWTHADLLRSSHPVTTFDTRKEIFHWMVDGWENVGEEPHPNDILKIIWAYERAQKSESAKEICTLITDYNLPREAIPTHFLNEPDVWRSLLLKMPLNALIRNLGKMSSVGILGPLSKEAEAVCGKLMDGAYIKASRLHPLSILNAMKVYSSGAGVKGSLTWKPNQLIVDALDDAFYLAFQNVEPTGKRIYLALDVSSSMTGYKLHNTEIDARTGAAAMALVTARTERNHVIKGFTTKGNRSWAFAREDSFMIDVPISAKDSLNSAINAMARVPFGGTDCALPMLDALENKIAVDCFVIYTDNETWHGDIHPHKALEKYRSAMGIPAKLVVVAMAGTQFTIANPDDAGMLDCVGFDTAAPSILADFIRQ